MIRLLEFLWHGCWHTWEPVRRINVYGDGFGNDTKMPTSFRTEFQCKKCHRRKEVGQ